MHAELRLRITDDGHKFAKHILGIMSAYQKKIYGKDIMSILHQYQPILNMLTIYPKSEPALQGEEACIFMLQRLMSILIKYAETDMCPTLGIRLVERTMWRVDREIKLWKEELKTLYLTG